MNETTSIFEHVEKEIKLSKKSKCEISFICRANIKTHKGEVHEWSIYPTIKDLIKFKKETCEYYGKVNVEFEGFSHMDIVNMRIDVIKGITLFDLMRIYENSKYSHSALSVAAKMRIDEFVGSNPTEEEKRAVKNNRWEILIKENKG
jgi:hypothetical protein